MYGYSGYPTISQAREMVARGDLGNIRIVRMQFAHGYFAEALEHNIPRLQWRLSQKSPNASYIIGDVGTHCLHMGQLISGLTIDRLSCMKSSFVAGRTLEDDAHVMIRYTNGAVGTLWASAVAVGSTHDFKIEIIGEKGSLRWWDEHPNQLAYAPIGEPFRNLDRGMNYLYDNARFERIGAGHPEGHFDSWANIYRNFALAMEAVETKNASALSDLWYPGLDDGIEGVQFIERCIESANNSSQWVKM